MVAAVGAGYFLFIVKPTPSVPSGGQPNGGAEGIEIPLYSGATESSIPSGMKSGFGITADLTCEGYITSASAEEVMNWYKNQMGDWTLMGENTFSPPDRPEVMMYTQHYRKDDNGVFIFAVSDPQMGRTIFGIVTGSWSLIQGCGEMKPPSEEPGGGPSPGGITMNYEAYPDTDDAPVLEFIWGPPDLQPSQIVRVSPYGVWEGEGGIYKSEPATEIEIVTTTTHNPVRAPCPGTITYVYVGEDGVGAVALRYGRNYVVIQHHVVDIPDNVVPGLKVEAGTLLGYTETLQGGGVGFWELELYVKRDTVFRTRPPYDYFSQESQAKLDSYMSAFLQRGYSDWLNDTSERDWTVTTGECWIKYLEGPEWWGDPSKTGYDVADPETLEEFLSANDMMWVLK